MKCESQVRGLFLPRIELVFQPVEQFRFVDQEFHQGNCSALRFDGVTV